MSIDSAGWTSVRLRKETFYFEDRLSRYELAVDEEATPYWTYKWSRVKNPITQDVSSHSSTGASFRRVRFDAADSSSCPSRRANAQRIGARGLA